MHEALVNRLGSLSLPRKNVVRFTDRPDMNMQIWVIHVDRPDMTIDVYRGFKTTTRLLVTTWHCFHFQ